MLTSLSIYFMDALESLLLVARTARDSLAAQASAEVKAELRKKLSDDLAHHASFAHTLCIPCQLPASLPVDSIALLSIQTDR